MTDATPPGSARSLRSRTASDAAATLSRRRAAPRNVAEQRHPGVAELADGRVPLQSCCRVTSSPPHLRRLRPHRVCVCDALPRRSPSTRPSSFGTPKRGKARVATPLLALCLSDDSREIARSRSFNAVTECALWRRCVLGEGRVPLLLWPEPGAEHIGDVPDEARFVLIVIDGTWKEAAEMRKRAGAACLTVHVGDGVTGLFAARKPPADGCLARSRRRPSRSICSSRRALARCWRRCGSRCFGWSRCKRRWRSGWCTGRAPRLPAKPREVREALLQV